MENGYSRTGWATTASGARVAGRTIYVKFGWKAGLFKAVIEHSRSRYGAVDIAKADERAIKVILQEFIVVATMFLGWRLAEK